MSDDDFLQPFQQQLLDQVEMAHQEVLAGGSSKGIVLIGDSGRGKTHAFDQVARRYPPHVEGDQRVTPCIRHSMTEKGDAASTSRGLLMQLNRPMPAKMPQDHETTLDGAVREQKTRIMLLEEVQHSLLEGTAVMRKQMLKYVKNRWNAVPETTAQNWVGAPREKGRHSVVIVLSATDAIRKTLAVDRELRNRYGTVIDARRLALYPPELFLQFRLVARAMVHRHELQSQISLNDGQAAVRLYLASDGDLRVLDGVLERAATLLRLGRHGGAIQRNLEEAFKQKTAQNPGQRNPFSMSDQELGAAVERAKVDFERAERLKASGPGDA